MRRRGDQSTRRLCAQSATWVFYMHIKARCRKPRPFIDGQRRVNPNEPPNISSYRSQACRGSDHLELDLANQIPTSQRKQCNGRFHRGGESSLVSMCYASISDQARRTESEVAGSMSVIRTGFMQEGSDNIGCRIIFRIAFRYLPSVFY